MALLIGTAAAALTLRMSLLRADVPRLHYSDFAVVWAGAGEWLAGRDPYTHIGPGRRFDYQSPLVYPAPALVAALPVAPLPAPAADAVFVWIGVTLAAFVVTARGWFPLLAFASFPMFAVALGAQWSPLLVAALFLPPLGGLLICKPNIGLALVAWGPPRRWWAWAVAGGVALLAVAFAQQPGWVGAYRAALQMPHASWFMDARPAASLYEAPVTLLAGPLVLLALTRWRRPEARLLVALACVPQTVLGYELLPLLLLVPRSRGEALTLAVLSWVPFWTADWFGRGQTTADNIRTIGILLNVCVLLPATVMILRRSNAGTAPAWAERAVAELRCRLRLRRPRGVRTSASVEESAT